MQALMMHDCTLWVSMVAHNAYCAFNDLHQLTYIQTLQSSELVRGYYEELCEDVKAVAPDSEDAEGSHVVETLGACLTLMCSTSTEAFFKNDCMPVLECWLPLAEDMLKCCTDLIHTAPAHGLAIITLQGEHAVLCCAVPCRAVPCRVVPCRVMPCRAVLCCVVLCCH